MNGGGEDLRSQGAANADSEANNRAITPKMVPSHAVQSFGLIFFSGTARDQHRRKKIGRQLPAAINANNLLKKKFISTTSPMQLLLRR
jgi:hypothetical protein